MKLVIITCSLRDTNTTQLTSNLYDQLATEQHIEHTVVSINSFNDLFHGTYITLDTATEAQAQVLHSMIAADILLFIVPIYYKSLPGSAKNFFDIVKCFEAYKNKIIGFVASNHKNQDYGARHAFEIVNGLLIFFNIQSVLVPEIIITNPLNPSHDEAARMLALLQAYYERYPKAS